MHPLFNRAAVHPHRPNKKSIEHFHIQSLDTWNLWSQHVNAGPKEPVCESIVGEANPFHLACKTEMMWRLK